jgi:uncharacterized Ntn-hydrolase superfamily protein
MREDLMTFSIVACDLERGDWGVAVASKFPAVGSVVPWAKAGVGAIATQAHANVGYGPDGLSLLQESVSAGAAIARLTGADDNRAARQVGVVDASGGAASFTGDECMAWADGMSGDGFACQGNILVGPEVVEAMAQAYVAAEGELADRLLSALAAGDAAGGDRRGRQSAALLVVREGGGYDGRNDRYVDLRVDDHADPVTELARVFFVFDDDYLIRNDRLMEATPELVREMQAALSRTGHYRGEAHGDLDDATRAALADFAGQVNLESKIREDGRLYRSLVREVQEVSGAAGG